eukprot:10121837-Alexandrium_andersonii.AAC.1
MVVRMTAHSRHLVHHQLPSRMQDPLLVPLFSPPAVAIWRIDRRVRSFRPMNAHAVRKPHMLVRFLTQFTPHKQE